MSWGLVAATAITVGAKVVGGAIQNKATNKAVAVAKAGAQEGANILSAGYEDARTAKLNALAKVGALTPEQLSQATALIQQGQVNYVDTLIASAEGYAQQMGDGGEAYRHALTGAGVGYGIAMEDIVNQYGNEITALAQQLGVDFTTAAGLYKDGLEKSADRYSGELLTAAQQESAGLEGAASQYGETRGKGLQAVTSALKPYAEGQGTPALDYLNQLVHADPTQLDPQQKLLREKFLRDSNARLAASGLRGAGRAGVAAVNTGDAELQASLYGQNRDRSQAAAGQMAQMGYGASTQIGAAGERSAVDTGNVAMDARNRGIAAVSSAQNTGATYGANTRATGLQAVTSASDRAAQARTTAGENAALAKKTSGETVAGKQLDLGKDAAVNDQAVTQKIAGVNLDIGQHVADQGLRTTDAVRAATDRGYDQARDTATKEGDINADAALGKAAGQAGAVTDPAWIAAQAAIAKGNVKAETIGSVGSSASDLVTKLI